MSPFEPAALLLSSPDLAALEVVPVASVLLELPEPVVVLDDLPLLVPVASDVVLVDVPVLPEASVALPVAELPVAELPDAVAVGFAAGLLVVLPEEEPVPRGEAAGLAVAELELEVPAVAVGAGEVPAGETLERGDAVGLAVAVAVALGEALTVAEGVAVALGVAVATGVAEVAGEAEGAVEAP